MMGLNQYDWNEYISLLVKANREQLDMIMVMASLKKQRMEKIEVEVENGK